MKFLGSSVTPRARCPGFRQGSVDRKAQVVELAVELLIR